MRNQRTFSQEFKRQAVFIICAVLIAVCLALMPLLKRKREEH